MPTKTTKITTKALPHSHLMKLPDGRALYVEMPAKFVRQDRDGSIGFTGDGVRFLDRVRAAALPIADRMSPGHVLALREALSLTQNTFGEAVGVDKLTVSRWERGEMKPNAKSLAIMRSLRNRAARRGIALSA